MSLQVKVTLDFSNVKRALNELGKSATTVIANQVINKTLTGIRTDATRELAQKAQVKKQATIRKRMIIKKSVRSRLKGRLIVPATNLPLSNQKGVRVTGRGKNRRVNWRGKKYKAFRIKGQVGALKDDIFIRNSNNVMVRAYAYTLLQEYRKHNVEKHLRTKASERFNKEFNRLVARKIKRLNLRK